MLFLFPLLCVQASGDLKDAERHPYIVKQLLQDAQGLISQTYNTAGHNEQSLHNITSKKFKKIHMHIHTHTHTHTEIVDTLIESFSIVCVFFSFFLFCIHSTICHM